MQSEANMSTSIGYTAGQARIKTLRSAMPSSAWREYFRHNARHLMPIAWERGVILSEAERTAIAKSIQQFQLGESSDGGKFLRRGWGYARVSGDRQYLHALRRFIAEEQRHGRDLGRAMDLAGIPRIRHAWADTIFRWMRHTGGLERSIMVLVTAEVIAQVYYDALRDATQSIVLRQLCNQVLRDESQHVRFQCERLAILRQRRRRISVALRQSIHIALMSGTCLVFWLKHARAMRAGGYGFWGFVRAVSRRFVHALRLASPRRYSWTPSNQEPTDKFAGPWLEL
jgi:hypothetical protein